MATTIIERLGPYGNQSPSNWCIQFGPHEKIIGLIIWCGDIVDAIAFVATDLQNEVTTTTRFGGHSGNYQEIPFKEDEYMTKISGRHALYQYGRQHLVASIRIHTNLSPDGYGPYGNEIGCINIQEFSFSLPSSPSDLAGFFGGRGQFFQSIGAYIKRTIKKLGPWGSPYPPNWNLELDPRETIKEVRVRSGWIIDGFEFIIEDNSNGMTTTKRFGGTGGDTYVKIQLEAEEQITDISGTYGFYEVNGHWHLASIKIHTNLKPDGYGPFGKQTSCQNIQEFSSSIPSGCAIVGFFGRAGQYFDCIGVYTKTVD